MPRKKTTSYPNDPVLLYAKLEKALAEANEAAEAIRDYLNGQSPATAKTPMGKATKPPRSKGKVKDSYSEEELAVMGRVKLVQVAEAFGIEHKGVHPPKLRMAIMDHQEGHVEEKAKPARRSKKKTAKKRGKRRIRV